MSPFGPPIRFRLYQALLHALLRNWAGSRYHLRSARVLMRGLLLTMLRGARR